MKILIQILFIFLLTNVSCQEQVSTPCEILTTVLQIEQLNNHLNLSSKPIGQIRVVDQSGLFKNCRCTYQRFSIGVLDQIPLDFNTGRYIDFAILSFEESGSVINLEIFYALSGQNDPHPNLYTGTIKLIRSTDRTIKVEQVNIGNMQ